MSGFKEAIKTIMQEQRRKRNLHWLFEHSRVKNVYEDVLHKAAQEKQKTIISARVALIISLLRIYVYIYLLFRLYIPIGAGLLNALLHSYIEPPPHLPPLTRNQCTIKTHYGKGFRGRDVY